MPACALQVLSYIIWEFAALQSQLCRMQLADVSALVTPQAAVWGTV